MRTTFTSFFLFALITVQAFSQGWEWQNPRPHGETVNDMLMVDAWRGVAVCNNGYYMYTGDGGRSWVTYRLGNANLERIIQARDGSLILLSDRQRIYRSTDMAYSWELVYSVWKFFNGAASFDLVMTPDGTILAMANGPHFVKSVDNGQSWTRFAENDVQISNETPRSLSVQSNTVWRILGNWGLYLSTDAGETWEMEFDRDRVRGLQRFVHVDSLYGYQLRDGQLLRTHDGGENWDEMDIYGFGTVRDVLAGGSLGDAVFCLSLGNYLVNASSDRGDSWNVSLTETAFADAVPNTIAFVDAQTGFVAGDGGRILRTEDGGQSWSIVHGIGYIGTITKVLFTDDNFGIATTYSSTVLLTNNGGKRWDESIPSPDHTCDALAASPEGTIFLIATTPSYEFDLLRSTDKGKSWELRSRLPIQYTSTNPEMAQSILAISDDELLVGATFGILLRSFDGGLNWERSLVQPGISNPFSTGTDLFHFPPSTFIYMQSNGLHLSTDGGLTWEARLTPRARSIWETQFITPDIGYGLISGDFSRTTDGGLTWETTPDFTPQLLHFFDATNGMVLWSDPQLEDMTFIMTTADGGKTWEKFSMGERAAYSGWFFRSASRMWGYGYGGAIRYNGDGGIVDAGTPALLPSSLQLNSGYPNPFSPSRHPAYRIPFTSGKGGAVHVQVFDLLGRNVGSVSGASVEAGAQVFDLPSRILRGLTTGMYLYRMQVGAEFQTGRLRVE